MWHAAALQPGRERVHHPGGVRGQGAEGPQPVSGVVQAAVVAVSLLLTKVAHLLRPLHQHLVPVPVLVSQHSSEK